MAGLISITLTLASRGQVPPLLALTDSKKRKAMSPTRMREGETWNGFHVDFVEQERKKEKARLTCASSHIQ